MKKKKNFMLTNIPEDLWTATKVMVALMDTNLKIFIMDAIREKLAREKDKREKQKA